MIAAAAYLIIGISISDSPAHQSVDAIEYPAGMADCMRALAGMKAKIAERPASEQSRLTRAPYCTDERPVWWIAKDATEGSAKPRKPSPAKGSNKRIKIPGYAPALPVPSNWKPDGKGGYVIE